MIWTNIVPRPSNHFPYHFDREKVKKKNHDDVWIIMNVKLIAITMDFKKLKKINKWGWLCKKCLHILSRYSIILKNVYYSYHIPRLPKHIFQIQFPHNNIWQSLEIEFLSSHDSSYNINIEWWTLRYMMWTFKRKHFCIIRISRQAWDR